MSTLRLNAIQNASGGDYTVNFTTALADANYYVIGNIGQGTYGTLEPQFTSAQTTTTVRLQARNASNTAVDPQTVTASAFR